MIQPNFTPFPILTTDRLVLRQLEITDDKDYFFLRSDENLNKYLEGHRHHAIEETQAFIEKILKGQANNEWIFWIITLKESKQFIGSICLWNLSLEHSKAETGYSLHPDYQGKGYMYEALAKMIEYGFNTMELETIEAYTHRDNASSTNLLKRSNFIQDTERKLEEGSNDIIFVLTNRK